MTINLLCLSHGGFHLSPCFRRPLTLLFDDVMSADLLNSVPHRPAEITFGLHDASGCLCVVLYRSHDTRELRAVCNMAVCSMCFSVWIYLYAEAREFMKIRGSLANSGKCPSKTGELGRLSHGLGDLLWLSTRLEKIVKVPYGCEALSFTIFWQLVRSLF